jgi:Mg-chelatase subunit ChlI
MTEEEICTIVGRIGGRVGRGEVRNQRVDCQLIRRAAKVATSPTRQSSPPRSCTKTSRSKEESDDTEGSEKKEGSEETEGSEDSYYIPDDYYSDESGYDSNIFKKCWEDDF